MYFFKFLKFFKYPKYEAYLQNLRNFINPLLDGEPPIPFEGKWSEKMATFKRIKTIGKIAYD